MTLLPAKRRSPPPKLLSSDDESSPLTIPSSLRSIPHFYPNLPPKHTYLRTPVCIRTLKYFAYPSLYRIAVATTEAGIAVLGEKIKKRKPCSGVATTSFIGDRGRRRAG